MRGSVLEHGFLVLALQFVEIGTGLYLGYGGYYGVVELAALTVIARAGKVYAASLYQVAGLCTAGLVAGFVNGYRVASLALYYAHAGYVGLSVTKIDHVLERNRAALIGHGVINLGIAPYVIYAFVYHENELGLGGEIHCHCRPDGLVILIHERAGV